MLKILLAAVVFSIVATAQAQIGAGNYVQPYGAITPGNCAKWVNSLFITDAGKVCGGAVGSCDGTINLGACAQPMLGGVGGAAVVICDGSINLSSGCSQPILGAP